MRYNNCENVRSLLWPKQTSEKENRFRKHCSQWVFMVFLGKRLSKTLKLKRHGQFSFFIEILRFTKAVYKRGLQKRFSFSDSLFWKGRIHALDAGEVSVC